MPELNHINRSKLVNLLDGKKLLTSRSASVTVDTTNYIYIGTADPGSSESDPVRLIQRTALYADNTTAILFANGRAAFDQAWADRSALSYS